MSFSISGAGNLLIVGGGPSGAAAATWLARWGHAVTVVDRPSTRPALAESLPPSCRGLLDVLGATEAVDRIAIRASGNTVWWGGAGRRVELFPAGQSGWQVDREAFDATLRNLAVEAGVEWLRPAQATEVRQAGDEVQVTVEEPGARRVLAAPWILDCSGRSGLVGRRLRTGAGEEWRTVALARVMDAPGGWELPDESHTLVESAEWGWGWSVPTSATRRYFTVMFQPVAGRFDRSSLDDEFDRRIVALPALAGVIARGVPAGPAFACDATMYHAHRVVDGRALVVGDAASFLDPLSSFGVKKALASAWLAATAVHTALVTPGATEVGLQLFAEREAAYVRGVSAPLKGLSQDAMGAGDRFWGIRASLEADDPDADALARFRRDPRVNAAFRDLRQRADAIVRTGPVGVVQRPLVRGNLIGLEDHFLFPDTELPIRFLRNVDLVVLRGLAREGMDVGALCVAYAEAAGARPLPDILGAISVLVARGALVVA